MTRLSWLLLLVSALPGLARAQSRVTARDAEEQVRAAYADGSVGLAACASRIPAGEALDLELEIRADGAVVLVGLVVPRPAHFSEIAGCIERLLPHVAPIASRHRFRMRVASIAVATTAAETPASPPTASWPRHDGTAGAVCGWGWGHSARPTESPPTPAPCGAGLECCAMGGAFVADSVCRSAPCGPSPP